VRISLSFINVYKKKSTKSEIVTQLLYGDTFKKIKKTGSWLKIKNDLDNYKGYIKLRKYLPNIKNTHKVSSLSAKLYSKPNLKNKTKKLLSFGSKIKVIKKQKKFYKFDKIWVKKKDVKKINYKSRNIFQNSNIFLNVKYKWGGKHYHGIDCSALVQLMLNFNNKFCPRDTKDQINFFKKKIRLSKLRKGDLIFWKGHVAIALSRKKLIHAYGPMKKTLIMPVNFTINKILKTAKLKVIAIRRVL